jgi:hypothetical protein
MAKKTDRKTIDTVFVLLGAAATVVLLVIGVLAWVAYSFATGMVRDELSAQKVYFPPKDSPALTSLPAADQEAMSRYAGRQLTTGDQAKVYADNFINVHLSEVADGKSFAEVSTEAMKDPTNQALQAKKAALFQGETLRGLLLGSGYAYWTMGMIAKLAAIAAFIGAAVMAVLVWLGMQRISKQR